MPFKGAPEAVTAVMRSDVQFYFAPIPSAEELGNAGKVQGDRRQFRQAHPAASGCADLAKPRCRTTNTNSWFGVMAPAGTPSAILDKVSQDIAAVLQDAGREREAATSRLDPDADHAGQFDTIIKNDTERYTKVFKDAGIEPHNADRAHGRREPAIERKPAEATMTRCMSRAWRCIMAA